jgi:hypothetical protein
MSNNNKQLVLDLASDESDIKDEEIPVALLEQKAPVDKQKRAVTRTSNFIITANPNVSYRTLTNPQDKIKFAKKLIAFCKNVQHNLANHKLLKEFTTAGYKFPNLTRFEFAIESGDRNGFIHAHMMVMFDGYCQLRLPILTELLNHSMGTTGYINVQSFNDTTKLVSQYVAKNQNTIYKSDNTVNQSDAKVDTN